jgi:hypothetical protein
MSAEDEVSHRLFSTMVIEFSPEDVNAAIRGLNWTFFGIGKTVGHTAEFRNGASWWWSPGSNGLGVRLHFTSLACSARTAMPELHWVTVGESDPDCNRKGSRREPFSE